MFNNTLDFINLIELSTLSNLIVIVQISFGLWLSATVLFSELLQAKSWDVEETEEVVPEEDPMQMTQEDWRTRVVKATTVAVRLNERELFNTELSYNDYIQRQNAYEQLEALGCAITVEVMVEEQALALDRISRLNYKLCKMFA